MSTIHYIRSIADATTLCGSSAMPRAVSTSAPDVTCAQCKYLMRIGSESVQNHYTVEVTDTDSVHGIPADSGLDFPTQDELRRRWAIEQATRIFQGSGEMSVPATIEMLADLLIDYVIRKDPS